MRVYHPQGMYNNMPPENVFLAADEMGNEVGVGYIIRVMQPNVFPDRPVNLYIAMDCHPTARYILFGALVARARQMRDENPQLKARVYTAITPGDARTKEFYLHNGFTCEDTEDMLRLEIPAGDGKIPMSCAVAPVPLNSLEEQNAFIYRLVSNDITFVDLNYLQGLMRMPHFLALGLYRNTDLIGEIIMAGEGDACELVSMYITAPNRRQGMGRALLHRSMAVMAAEGVTKVTTIMAGEGDACELVSMYITAPNRRQGMGRALLHRSMAVMAAEGVTKVTTRILSRSIPQKKLMESFQCRLLGVSTVYPGMNID